MGPAIAGHLRRQQPEQGRTKNEDNDNYPQPTNPGKGPILIPKLEAKEIKFS